MELTAVITCKDRLFNARYCIASIASCKPRPHVILVDFNSTTSMRGLQRTFPWLNIVEVRDPKVNFHKARALNIGIKRVQTEFTCLTDVDQIFQPNFFNCVLSACREDRNFVMCDTHFLETPLGDPSPAAFDRATYFRLLEKAKKSKKRPHGEGCCHGVSTEWLRSVRGLDERYIGWGFEDKDLVLRAKFSGYSIVSLSSKTSMVHLPHSRDKKYFNKKLRLRNERLYKEKRASKDVIANVNTKWGAV